MPPKTKITKEMILQTVLEITRQAGFEAVNARRIAGELHCSTRPLFTCYKNMEELKRDFLAFAYVYYEQYVAAYGSTGKVSPYLLFPLSYIAFAREEAHLFQLLFINDMDLEMTKPKDFYKEPDNEKRARAFSQILGIGPEQAKEIFLDLFLYTHGIAVLTAAKKLTLGTSDAEKMLTNILSALLRREDPGWSASI